MQAVVGFPSESLVASAQEIASHVGEIDVATVEEAGGIAFGSQRRGDGGQFAALFRNLHDRREWEGGIAAQGAHRPTVGTPCISIALGEVDAFAAQLVQPWGNLSVAANLGELSATALHQDNHHVGPCGVEQRVGVFAHGGENALRQPLALIVGVEVVVDDVVARLAQ